MLPHLHQFIVPAPSNLSFHSPRFGVVSQIWYAGCFQVIRRQSYQTTSPFLLPSSTSYSDNYGAVCPRPKRAVGKWRTKHDGTMPVAPRGVISEGRYIRYI